MTVGLGSLDSLLGQSFVQNSVAAVTAQSDITYGAGSTKGIASLTGTLSGPGEFPGTPAVVTAVDDTADTITLTYGGSTSLTWFVVGANDGSLLISFNSNHMDALAPVNSTGLLFNALSLNGADLADSPSGTDLTWSAFGPPVSVNAALSAFQSGTLPASTEISDSAADVQASLDALQKLVAAGGTTAILLTDAGTPSISLTAAQLSADSAALNSIGSNYGLIVSDIAFNDLAATLSGNKHITSYTLTASASSVSASIDTLQTEVEQGKLSSISLTDGGTPTIGILATQSSADSAALAAISGNFNVSIAGPGTGGTITGVAGHASVMTSISPAFDFTVTPTGDGHSFALSGFGYTEQVSNVTALQFGDYFEFIASNTPLGPGGAITSAEITDIYAAVFGRTPDAPGLAFYETYAAAHPSVGIVTYAQYFLTSPEYTNNPAHDYAQSPDGDARFITDTYQNLLHRAPEAGAVSFYQSNVINPALANLTPGTPAYANAELQAHAQVLSYFSASAEFLGDVQVTAQHPADAQHWLVLI